MELPRSHHRHALRVPLALGEGVAARLAGLIKATSPQDGRLTARLRALRAWAQRAMLVEMVNRERRPL